MITTQKAPYDKLVGYMMYAVSVGMPLTNLPQLLQLYSTKVTTGLSASSWIMYTVLGFIPLLYAFVNKLRPLVISNILWLVVDGLMIYGILRYSPHLLPTQYSKLLLINNIGKAIDQIGFFCLSASFALFAYDIIHVKQGGIRVGR